MLFWKNVEGKKNQDIDEKNCEISQFFFLYYIINKVEIKILL